ncbi:hypothetical protein [Tenacibaculum finnmarkense]|uniref:Uncharacterized protein n=1 Tax=Tenacibaculum finnmarkense genomovar finnmarkense TaxID=1458503 RepID=A0AAP1RDG6_9FLAO|nr:hypothetical protein [Tenacibaculum finnmarkense]MBE7651964.1 hypothetical protein [Tenacibaculum finnmarkense genomovar finnmarkense]MBE7694321.1 hypothetical protein [Tenacibaculum finnmarkense genomovar finnmarkense]MCD8409280.1 hypothetical protein [Tenacibaculum finnmarkense genomovar ulcerans]MCD8426181.1 hypothetical protein [Tenacibaculum finnmarkense genomovar finnmarkense]MCD8440595.1 hypothetical protein [Tenacibaculum finnmarkense genomovar ulcerans]
MNEIGFKLEKINTEQFAIIEDAYDTCCEEIGLEAIVKFGINSENPAIISIIKFQFEQNKKPFLIIEVSCEFGIEETKWNIFNKGTKIHIPKDFLAHLAMITVGTTRGVLHSKTDNTIFNEFILPTLNVSQMITEDGEFEK